MRTILIIALAGWISGSGAVHSSGGAGMDRPRLPVAKVKPNRAATSKPQKNPEVLRSNDAGLARL